MRYEDASHTGALQGQGPVANDDTEILAAGSKSAATGNLITGEGTQTGSVGADIATGGHITAIAGKSGEDSSFSGGKLSVMGEYGRLSVDADGNYVYQANKGVENVRDRFSYTLADNQGATDSASLIVEIGKTPVVIKANAQQVVVGPDGVVTLPPGVELSDVHVVGRNLVIDMPDGSQMIIIDGAVFVPQLVLNGVEVPATNVAALLVGQEIQPAAGETPPSSGGNFAVPPPPLDPGVPLGDLIPPTELDFTVPEPEEVFDFLDQEPEIFVQPDGQPASVNAVDQVEEAGLASAPPRIGNLPNEPAGSGESADGNSTDNDVTTETTAGIILINSPDGVDSVTINGFLVTGVIGQTIPGAFGMLTITGFSGDDILYSYTLSDNTSGNDTHDDFAVVLTDDDGDEASATLRIDIIDDVPTARPDTDTVGVGGFLATGNVMTDAALGDIGDTDTNAADTVGADNARVTFIDSVNAAPGANVPDGSFVDIAGQYGMLRIFSNGDYVYTRNEQSPGGVDDVFNYTLTDGDGDTSTTTLTITIPDTPIVVPFSIGNGLDEDALPNGIEGGIGDVVPSLAFISDDINVSGGDGALTFSLRATGAPPGFTYVLDPVTGDLLIQQGGVTVIVVTLDAATGDYTITLVAAIDHPVGGDENDLSFNITVRVTDSDGDFVEGTGLLTVDDDSPVLSEVVSAGDVTLDESDAAPPAGFPISDTSLVPVIDFTAAFGADGAAAVNSTVFGLAITGGPGSGLQTAVGDFAITLVQIDGDTIEGHYNGSNVAFIIQMNGDGTVTLTQNVPLEHLVDGPPGPAHNDALDLAGLIAASVTITDGDGDVDSASVGIGGALVFLDDGPSVTESQVTGLVDEDGVLEGAADGGEGDGIAGGIGDVAGAPTVASGSVAAMFNSGADAPLSFGFAANAVAVLEALGLTSNGIALDYAIVGNTVTASTAAGDVFTFELNADGSWEFTLIDQLDHAEGNNENDLTINLGAIIEATDADGDFVVGNANGLVITVDDDTPTANGNQVTGTVDEDGVLEGAANNGPGDGIAGGPGDVAGEATVANGSVASLFNSGADEPLSFALLANTSGLPALTSGGVAVTYAVVGNTLTASAGGNTVFTFVLNGDGSWTFTLVDQIDHPTLNGQAGDDTENDLSIDLSSVIAATDADGDSVNANAGALVITVDDDTPIATGAQVTGTVDEDGVLEGAADNGPGDGIAGGPGDVAGAATVANGSVSTLFQSGADEPLSFALLTNTSGLPALTSGGVAVTYSVVGNLLTASAGGSTVFTFLLNGDGSFTFTLVDQIDHPTLNGQAGDDTENDLSIDLSSLISATDADGDTVNANAGALVITVDDDTPIATQNQVTGTVDEDGVLEGAANAGPGDGIAGGPGDVAGEATVANGSVASLFQSGADEPLTFSLLANTSGLPAVTSGGVAVTYSVVGNTLTASAGASTVFTFVLNADGSWTFTLVDQLDHATLNDLAGDNTENDLSIALGSIIQATDRDGDSVTANANGLVITVDDDTPIATGAQVTGTVDEDGVLEGAANAGPGDGIAGGPGDVAGEATVATGSVSTLFQSGADEPLSFSLSTVVTALTAQGLTSNGVALSYAVVGNTLTATAPGGNTIFTFVLQANGDWTFTLVDQLDHPTLNGLPGDDTENDLAINLSSIIQATDFDGDTVVAGANGLIITVDDDTPVARNDTDAVVAGGDTTTGNVITGVDTTSGATGADSTGADEPAQVTGLASNNVPANVDNDPAGGGFVVAGQFGVLTMQSDGSYLYDRNDGAPGDVQDVFTYRYTDRDGDTVTATLTISIQDSAPLLVAPPPALLDDDDVIGAGGNPGGPDDDAPANTSGSLAPLVTGGDGDIDFFFSGVQPALPAGFTHNLVNSTTMQILQGATVVLTITLNNETGAYSILQNNPVDHASLDGLAGDNTENNLGPLNVGLVAIDENGLGDSSNVVNLSITVDDDTPVATATQLTGTVDEDGVLEGAADAGPGDGIAGGTGDVAGQDVSATGSVTTLFSIGADKPGTYQLVNAAALNALGLTSNGVALSYSIGFAAGVYTLTASAPGGNTIFTFTLNESTGAYNFTLVDQLDHPTLNGGAGDNTENDLTINLSAIIQVTDFDGDSVLAGANGLIITVDDDTPIATGVQLTGTVDEDGVVENVAVGVQAGDGIAGGTNDVAGEVVTASGSVTTLFQSGADEPLTYQLVNAAALNALALTSGGVALTYSIGFAAGVYTLTASAPGGNTIFTLTLNEVTGAYTFTLVDQLDHPTLNGLAGDDTENDLSINLSAIIQATDRDGDSVPAGASALVITVDDDMPAVFDPEAIGAGELFNEAGSTQTADLDTDANINNNVGADEPGLVQFANIVNGDDSGFDSGGVDIEYWLSNNGQTLQGRINSTNGSDGTLIFTVQLNQGAGTYTVTMAGEIDNGAGVTFNNLTSTKAGNVDVRGVGADDPLTTVDLLLTASKNGANATINTSSATVGSANQSMDLGETIRIDFVTNLEDDPADDLATFPSGFSYDGHVGTNSFLQLIPQVQGEQEQTVAFRVSALNTTVTDAASPDDDPGGPGDGWSDASVVQITHVTIDGFDVGETPVTVAIGAVGVWTPIAYGVFAQLQADGSVIFTGVQQGDQYGITTGTDFNAIAVTTQPSGTGPGAPNNSTADSFDLGVFSIGQVDTGDPINLSFDLQLTDFDGDTIVVTDALAIQIDPAADAQASLNLQSLGQAADDDSSSSSLLASDSQEQQVQKVAANSNSLTMATVVAAAGMADSAAASSPPADDQPSQLSEPQVAQTATVERLSGDDGSDSSSLAAQPAVQEAVAGKSSSSSHGNGNANGDDNQLDVSSNQSSDEGSAHQAANDDHGPATAEPQVAVAPSVQMVSAEALQGAALDGDAKQDGSVEKIIAEALGHGNGHGAVDALLNAIHDGNGGSPAVANLASPADNAVSAWDMASNGGSTGNYEMLMKVGAEMLHHDAVQPTQNG